MNDNAAPPTASFATMAASAKGRAAISPWDAMPQGRNSAMPRAE